MLRLDWCEALYMELPPKNIPELHLVQHAAARLLTGSSFVAHVTSLLYQLQWLSCCCFFWVQFKVLVVTFKVLTGFGPVIQWLPPLAWSFL